MNLMILSPGRRCELVKSFKDRLNMSGRKVIALDMNKYAPALYFADKYHVIKKDFSRLGSYVDDIIRICKKEKVGFLLTLIDPELEILSKYHARFESDGMKLILPDDNVVKTTFDKYLFYLKYKDLLPLALTCFTRADILKRIRAGDVKYPVMAKPRKGSASIGIRRVDSARDFPDVGCDKDHIYQEFLYGKEIGIDAYFDLISGRLVSVFMKEKIAMRSGETDKSVSFFSGDILKHILKLECAGGYKGPIDIDAFVSKSGKIRINEINTRFGGGYAHAHYCGADFIKLAARNMEGRENKANLGDYKTGVVMMKCNRFVFMKDGEVSEE